MTRTDILHRIKRAKRAVIKVGTSLLTDDQSEQGVNRGMIERIRREIVFLRTQGVEVMLVTSAAVGMGRQVLRRHGISLSSLETSIARRQALAAIGQPQLISFYAEIFGQSGIQVSQLLLTARDFLDRRAYLNIGHTIQELTRLGVLAIVNENDTVSTEELRFGDNDLLSAACASLFKADLLVILTSVEGFLVNEKRVPFLERVKSTELAFAGGPTGPGSGGMYTKLRAGQLCLQSGSVLAILPGREENPVQRLFSGEDLGTVIGGPPPTILNARKKWLLYTRTEGAVYIDAGAKLALEERGSSLLPVGIHKLDGHFLAGDVIEIFDESGATIGRGIANYSARELRAVIGMRGEDIVNKVPHHRNDVVIHRNNLILERN